METDRDTEQKLTFHLPASGRKESNGSSTEPSDVSVRTRSIKRKTGSDGDTPQKRKRVSESASGRTGGIKKNASRDEEDTRKRQRTSQTGPPEDFVKVKGTKRKASVNDNEPRKRQRVSELDQRDKGSEDATSSFVEPATPTKKTDDNTTSASEETSRQEFEAKYEQLTLLGEGGFGSVYAGYRRADRFPVAIKHIPRDKVVLKVVTKSGRSLPLEVAIMLKLACGAASVGKSAAVSLLDYYDLDQELILVLERPVPSFDLFDYMEAKEGSLQEEEARHIEKQLVEAAMELQSKEIFHRDIKVENILIDTSSDVPRLRLIDFGLGCFTMKTTSFRTFYGTAEHSPPEWRQCSTYSAGPTTVWQLGVVLYEILHWDEEFETTEFLNNKLNIKQELSRNCQDMLRMCLAEDPQQRPTLEELQVHPWFTSTSPSPSGPL